MPDAEQPPPASGDCQGHGREECEQRASGLHGSRRTVYTALAMGTPWDRAAEGYLVEWVPRFVPYHLDLVSEMALRAGERVLVTSAGPGAEVLAVARAIGEAGVRPGDRQERRDGAASAASRSSGRGLATQCECAEADAEDAHGGPWDAVLCAFGLWQLPSRVEAIRAWAEALAPSGKVGIITWGPSDPGEPFQLLSRLPAEIEPDTGRARSPRPRRARRDGGDVRGGRPRDGAPHARAPHADLPERGGASSRAMRESCTWRRLWEEMGDARMQRVAARFYERVGGPGTPLSFDPPATIAIAALPGAQIELQHRPSVRAPG